MKFTQIAACLALSLPALSSMAAGVTQDLGTLDANGTDFGRQFARFFDVGSPVGAFTDYYTFSLIAPATGAAGGAAVDFEWLWVDLNLNSVSLYRAGDANLLGTSSPGAFSFSGLGAGNYKLAVAGTFNGSLGAASYSGAIRSIASAAPEASSFAMALVGLLGVGAAVAKRRRS